MGSDLKSGWGWNGVELRMWLSLGTEQGPPCTGLASPVRAGHAHGSKLPYPARLLVPVGEDAAPNSVVCLQDGDLRDPGHPAGPFSSSHGASPHPVPVPTFHPHSSTDLV